MQDADVNNEAGIRQNTLTQGPGALMGKAARVHICGACIPSRSNDNSMLSKQGRGQSVAGTTWGTVATLTDLGAQYSREAVDPPKTVLPAASHKFLAPKKARASSGLTQSPSLPSLSRKAWLPWPSAEEVPRVPQS